MRSVAIVVGAAIAFGGAVWILQGLGVSFAPKSFMTGNREWVFIGGAAVVVGLGIVGWSRRKA